MDERHRGAARCRSLASSIVREPYVEELLDVEDAIDERDVDACMII